MSYAKLEGADKLLEALKKALTKHSAKDVRKSLKRGADIIIQAAKSNVTIQDGGRLRNSIKLLPQWSKDPTGLYVAPKVIRRFTKKTSQKAKDANPYYAHWWEYGTDPHDLSYQGRFVSEKKGTRAQHPGTGPHPYMRPAYDGNKQRALDVMMEDITKLIESKV